VNRAAQRDHGRLLHVLGRFGKLLPPLLEKARASKDPDVRSARLQLLSAAGAAGLAHLAEALRDPDPAVRRHAVQRIGSVEDPRVPVLLEPLLADPELHGSVPDALRSNPLAALALGLRAASSDSRAAREAACECLGHAGARGLDALRGLAGDAKSSVRLHAARALARLGHAALPAAPELRALLADPDDSVRHAAAYAVGRLGEGGAVLLPELARMVRDGPEKGRASAAGALGAFGEAAARHLVPHLAAKDGGLRRACAQSLTRIGAAAVPAIAEALVEGDAAFRPEAATVLGKMKALPALVELLQHAQPEVRRAAAYGIGTMEAGAVGALDALIAALGDGNAHVVAQAAWALGRIGPAAERALPALRKLQGGSLRGVVTEALDRIDPD
jgi:HEAT repeat protein